MVGWEEIGIGPRVLIVAVSVSILTLPETRTPGNIPIHPRARDAQTGDRVEVDARPA